MKTLFTHEQLQITLQRLARQLVENHDDFANTVIVGLQPRGVYLSDRIYKILKQILKGIQIDYGRLDITFYRDDYSKEGLPMANETDIPFSIEGKNVILIDDVLFTGRTIRSGLDALIDFGRPESIKLLVLIDRKFSRELPIQPDYIGISVDSVASQRVKVLWQENDDKDEVVMI